MSRRVIFAVILVLLLTALTTPLANTFDHWDNTPGLFADTEFQVAACALLAALYLVVALLLLLFQEELVPLAISLCKPPVLAQKSPPPRIIPCWSPPPIVLRI